MSNLRAAGHRETDPRMLRAITDSLDLMAERLPELLSLPDSRMILLEVGIEQALARALKPPVQVHGKVPQDRTTARYEKRFQAFGAETHRGARRGP